MCKVSKDKSFSTDSIMEGEKLQQNQTGSSLNSSNLLELAAADDVSAFISGVEERNINLDDMSFWYGRRSGTTKMGLVVRTPLMIASLYGSIQVLKYLVNSQKVNVNKASVSDGATALHCAAAGGSHTSVEAVKLLLDACADVDSIDANGNKPADLIARGGARKSVEMLMGFTTETVLAKKEYPIDVSLPDINNGVYGTDEFRMYVFKVKPCSRAYTHDWTECPFVHPGENARRRDPKKFLYSCVPCPEFRKGSCVKGDGCEYAHGVFESWLHPAQYRTRLCKDETGCTRKVCFFAHKVEELRPLYASTGSAMPEPNSGLVEMGSMSPLPLGSTPAHANGSMWQNKVNHLTPPVLQLPRSRLKTALNARDFEQQQTKQMIGDLSSNVYNNSHGFGELKPKNLEDVFGSFDPSILSQFQGFSLQSPTARERVHQSLNQLRPSKPVGFGFDSSAAVAQAVMNSRSGAFAKQRSQSFIDRGSAGTVSHGSMPRGPWGSPDGKLEWGFNGEEANKLRKSASFGFRSGNGAPVNVNHEPDVSWVNTLVKDVSSVGVGLYSSSENQRYGRGGGGGDGEEKLPPWVEQMYIEQEQLVA